MLRSRYAGPGPIPPSQWVQDQQNIPAVRMGRDNGTVAGASRDNLSDCGNVTSQRFAEKPAWGHCSLLAGSRKTSSTLLPYLGCQQLAHGFLGVVRPRRTGTGRVGGKRAEMRRKEHV